MVIFGVYLLANTASAKKRAKQSEVRRARNASQKSGLRTALKKVLQAVQKGDKSSAQIAYQEVTKLADRAAGKHLIRMNQAARIKSRLNARLKAL